MRCCIDELGRSRRRPIEVALTEIDHSADGDHGPAVADGGALELAFDGSMRAAGDHRPPIQPGPPAQTYQHIAILDVDGQRVVLDSWTFPGTTRQRIAEAHEVVRWIDGP